ncbi:MAG: hypothetical protein SPI30_10695 [Prevotella sp.]|nr:hypothetical protein [Prevotella sp.]
MTDKMPTSKRKQSGNNIISEECSIGSIMTDLEFIIQTHNHTL